MYPQPVRPGRMFSRTIRPVGFRHARYRFSVCVRPARAACAFAAAAQFAAIASRPVSPGPFASWFKNKRDEASARSVWETAQGIRLTFVPTRERERIISREPPRDRAESHL